MHTHVYACTHILTTTTNIKTKFKKHTLHIMLPLAASSRIPPAVPCEILRGDPHVGAAALSVVAAAAAG